MPRLGPPRYTPARYGRLVLPYDVDSAAPLSRTVYGPGPIAGEGPNGGVVLPEWFPEWVTDDPRVEIARRSAAPLVAQTRFAGVVATEGLGGAVAVGAEGVSDRLTTFLAEPLIDVAGTIVVAALGALMVGYGLMRVFVKSDTGQATLQVLKPPGLGG